MGYLTEIKVRGYHADFYGHVNNARFLEFFEEDRWAHLEAKIDLHQWITRGLMFLVVNINVNYRKAVPVGAILQVDTDVEKIGTKSVVLRQEIRLKDSGEVAADAFVTFVIRDQSGRAAPIEGELLAAVRNLARPAAAEAQGGPASDSAAEKGDERG